MKLPLRAASAALFAASLSLPSCAQPVLTSPAATTNPAAVNQWMTLISPDNSFIFNIYRDRKQVASLYTGGWAPNWGWRYVGNTTRGQGDTLNTTVDFETDKAAGQIIHVALKAKALTPNSVEFKYTLSADKDVPLQMLFSGVTPSTDFQDGDATFTLADGTKRTEPLGFGHLDTTAPVSNISFHSKKVGNYSVAINPPTTVNLDHQARIQLAAGTFPAGTKTTTLTFTFPQKTDFLATDADVARFTKVVPQADWFEWKGSGVRSSERSLGGKDALTSALPTGLDAPNPLSFASWLDKPAGGHGGVREVGDGFQFEDKTPVKFWGTNLAYTGCAPPHDVADFTAARFAKWGVNAVRMHKFTGAGWEGIGDPNDATQFDKAGLDNFDYFANALTKNGVYYGWSHTYHFRPKAANKAKLLAYDEIQSNAGGDTYGLINFAPDVQDLLIESVVNLLQHKNPYTGKTYAQDPALSYIETQNEDDIFFYNSTVLDKCPTYKAATNARFAAWLQAKYKDLNGLKAAWPGSLKDSETLDAKNIEVQTNPWFMSSDNLNNKSGGEKQRLVDNALFFHAEQDAFYGKFRKAVRAAGYKGPLVGSPWQAANGLPHYLNLQSDAQMGYVDRHNYFGGGYKDTTLAAPGSGILSSGLDQVAGHPFGVSEWIHVYPSLYSAEGPAIIAAYGLGLQGWDASYEFQSHAMATAWEDHVGNLPWGVWSADVPTQVGQFPLLARMIARGDLREGAPIAMLNVTAKQLESGDLSFSDKGTANGDVKTLGGTVPPEALTLGKCVINYSKDAQGAVIPDISKAKSTGIFASNTGQLKWNANGQGFFSIDTYGTKGVVGFAGGKQNVLGDVSISVASPYASVLVTASGKTEILDNAKTALVCAVARNSNTGMSVFTLDNSLRENGKGPILIEPVKATIGFAKRKIKQVNILDHDGKPTGKTLAVTGHSFTINEREDKTIYYEIVFG